ncbi:hypothetical protein, partial [Rhizobium leguminosarum]|uniref:hypothetical protein n=1 Tax=Rhizobium leguminosarum TaxID=384 RepID=UPI003F9BF97D
IAVAIGSAIAAWMSSGRIVLLPAPFGTALLGLFSLDLAWNLLGLASVSHATTIATFFAGQNQQFISAERHRRLSARIS